MNDNHDNQPATISVEEAARILGISKRSTYRGAHDGTIPVLRVGNRILVIKAKLDELLGVAGGAKSE